MSGSRRSLIDAAKVRANIESSRVITHVIVEKILNIVYSASAQLRAVRSVLYKKIYFDLI